MKMHSHITNMDKNGSSIHDPRDMTGKINLGGPKSQIVGCEV
jgi:hypothetical protein